MKPVWKWLLALGAFLLAVLFFYIFGFWITAILVVVASVVAATLRQRADRRRRAEREPSL